MGFHDCILEHDSVEMKFQSWNILMNGIVIHGIACHYV